MIKKIGNVTILTNATTASGFATFILTSSKDLREFGLMLLRLIFSLFFTFITIDSNNIQLFKSSKRKAYPTLR